MELFQQSGPELPNQYQADTLLISSLARLSQGELPTEIHADLEELGELSGTSLYRWQLADRLNEPTLTHYDAWGNRIDQIEVTALWKEAERLTTRFGLIALPYEKNYGALSRVYQFALVYLFTPSTDIYSCPLAMTDGAASTLLATGNQALIDKALPRLTSRDPQQFWTSGQWMTELTGGSDVGLTETIARQENGQWRLHGRKWFTSATTAQMSLALARPEGNGPGGRGLALFFVELRDAENRLKNIEVCRLKDKLGTRKVPTAELLLHGTPAELVAGSQDGIKNIIPMLNITRTWNSVSAIALMRRGLALAQDYATKRVAFGAPLAEKPLHRDTLAMLKAELAGAFALTFEAVHLLGKLENAELNPAEQLLQRVITPLTKLITGKQAVACLSETLECFGGAGYVEDTGLPLLLRDAQVLPIWEGTTNVLSLDTLRALRGPAEIDSLLASLHNWATELDHPDIAPLAQLALQSSQAACQWLKQTALQGSDAVETGARRFALTLARSLESLSLARQTQWALTQKRPEASELLSDLKRFHKNQPLNSITE
jgi:acyl-CoA dehydrogenase